MTDPPDEGRELTEPGATEPPAAEGSGIDRYLHIFDVGGKEVFGSLTQGMKVSELGLLEDEPFWENVRIKYHAQNDFKQLPIGGFRVDLLFELQTADGVKLPKGVKPSCRNFLLIELESEFSVEHYRKYLGYTAAIYGEFCKKSTDRVSLTLVVIYGQNIKPEEVDFSGICGSLTFEPHLVFLSDFDADEFWETVKNKIDGRERLTRFEIQKIIEWPQKVGATLQTVS